MIAPNRPNPRVSSLVVICVLALLGLSARCMPDQVMVESNGDAVCGDGQLEAGEQCDDGNTEPGDGCSADCQTEVLPETDCSDGVDNDSDGQMDCDDSDCANATACQPVCGNGSVENGEECDDGNNTAGDGCSADCQQETGVEDCRNGTDDDFDGLVDCADPDCTGDPACNPTPMCGNGIVEAGEECDDANSVWCDGCTNTCMNQPTVETNCGDSNDEDCDGAIDCADTDCIGAPGCP